jgi:hypothetical protein
MRIDRAAAKKAHAGVNFRRPRAVGSNIGAYRSLCIIMEIDGHRAALSGSGAGS